MKTRQVLEEVTSIQLKKKTRDKLDKLGSRHESYDSIVARLIRFHEEHVK